MPGGPKANKSTKEGRLNYISDLIATGYQRYEVVNICAKEWGIKHRQVDRYLKIVYDFFIEQSKLTQNLENILLEYDKLIKKYEKRGDAKMAYQYRVHRDKVAGRLTNKVDVTSNGETIAPISINIIKPDESDLEN